MNRFECFIEYIKKRRNDLLRLVAITASYIACFWLCLLGIEFYATTSFSAGVGTMVVAGCISALLHVAFFNDKLDL